MRKKGKQWMRRMVALFLAVLLAVGMIPGNVLETLAEDPVNVTVKFTYSGDFGTELTDSMTVTIRDSLSQIKASDTIQKDDLTTGAEINFSGEPDNYTYEISSSAYGKPVTGAFTVSAPAEAADVLVDVSLDTSFDNVSGQFTTVTVSGKVTDGTNPISGVKVTGNYDSATGEAAFSEIITDENGEYKATVKINSNIYLTIEDPSGLYKSRQQEISTSIKDLSVQDISLETNTYKVKVDYGGNTSIIENVSINGDSVSEKDINFNTPYTIILTENKEAAGRYEMTVSGGAQAVYSDGKWIITDTNDDNSDINIGLTFTSKLEITNLKFPDASWSKDQVTITGEVKGTTSGFEVSLERKAADGEAIIDPAAVMDGNKFTFTLDCSENNYIKNQYRVVVTDNITGLTVKYGAENGECVYIDKVAPVIEEPVYSKDNTWYPYPSDDNDSTELWAKNGATYSVAFSDGESGIDTNKIQSPSEDKESPINVKVKGEQDQTIKTNTDTISVTDNAGNMTTKEIVYGIDNESPKVTSDGFVYSEGFVQDDVVCYWDGKSELKVKFEAYDSGVGIKVNEYSYAIKGLTDVEQKNLTFDISTGEGSITMPEIDEDGEYTVVVTMEDNLGNTCETDIATLTVDKTAPTIMYNFDNVTGIWDRLMNLLGIYHNETLEITVTATDKGLQEQTNGVGFSEDDKEQIFGNLEFNGKQISPVEDSITIKGKSATAKYKIVLEDNEGIKSTVKLKSVKDALRNEDTDIIATMGEGSNSNLTEMEAEGAIQILLEKKAPTVDVTKKAPIPYEDAIGRTWYAGNSEVIYEVTIKDEETIKEEASGLYDIECTINGKRVECEFENGTANHNTPYVTLADGGELGKNGLSESGSSRAKEANVKITLDSCARVESSGECVITFKATDNAGNVSDIYTDIIYFDVDNPTINNFRFNPADVNGNGADSAAITAIETDYGYFFNTAATVTVNVTDYIGESQTLGSGVASVQYKLIPVQNLDIKIPTGWMNTTKGDRANEYTFVVPEGFKGQICVRAIDNVKQKTSGYEENGLSPDKVVLEADVTHKANTSASITLNNTSYRDAKGNRLYAGTINATVLAKNSFAGIKNITYTRNDGTKGTQQLNTFKATISAGGGTTSGLSIQAQDENLVTQVGTTDAINYGSNVEVSDITLDMSMTCNSNHTNTVERQTVSYDTWAPRLEITWDNNDVRNGKYYNHDRTATIVVTERNFDESACEFITTGPSPSISGWSHNGDVHTATVTFSADGDYTFTFRTTDRAGHTTAYDRTDEFVIDQTNPVISVVYDNNSAQNGYYYQDARIATITITEHNFSGADVVTSMTANDNGAGIAAPSVNGWSSGNDTNVATISYNYDGEFTFGMNYTDLAGNPAEAYGEDHFVIDLTDPELEIYDIVDKSANNGEVAPGVRYYDTNVDGDGVTIELTGANNGAYSLDGSRSVSANGVDLKLNDFPHEKEIDDLYTMTAYVKDLSGRSAEQTVMFSVNRFGSVYVLDDNTKELVEENDGYTNKEQMVGIREINVDLLETSDISISRDGDLKKLKAEEDYKVKRSGSENTWKEYYYQLDKENFEEEGAYNVTVFSTDRAANSQDNKNNKREEACNVEFVIDKTAPSTVVTGIEDGGRYREVEKEVHIDSKDNIRLAKVVVEIDGQVTEYDSNEISGSSGAIDLVIGSADKWQNVKIYSVDKAGNTDEEDQTTGSMRVIVTSNLWVQFINNTPLLAGVIALLACAAGGCIWFFIFAKRKKEAVQ